MSGYTYQQLEVIRKRAKAIGLDAEFEPCATADIAAYLYVPTPVDGVSISYYPDQRSRLVMAMIWGRIDFAAEIEALHATLTADFPEPLEPGYGRVCRGCAKALYPVGCESGGCAVRAAETSEAAP